MSKIIVDTKFDSETYRAYQKVLRRNSLRTKVSRIIPVGFFIYFAYHAYKYYPLPEYHDVTIMNIGFALLFLMLMLVENFAVTSIARRMFRKNVLNNAVYHYEIDEEGLEISVDKDGKSISKGRHTWDIIIKALENERFFLLGIPSGYFVIEKANFKSAEDAEKLRGIIKSKVKKFKRVK